MNQLRFIRLLFPILMVGGFVQGNDEDLIKRIEILEKKIQARNLDPSVQLQGMPKWISKFRLSGNGDVSYYNGEKHSHSPDSRFAVDNARLFFDFELSETMSFYYEWDIIREASLQNKVGQMYLRIDRLFDIDALNLKAGRMPIPFGEEYLRFHEQRFENPLISFSEPAPYNWDEGFELFGSFADNRLDYVIAVMDGDNDFNENSQESLQLVGKLTYRPLTWLHLSFSAVDTGKLGSTNEPGISALEFGGSHAYTIHSINGVPNFQNGVQIPDDPSLSLSLSAWEFDAIIHSNECGRIWLAYGHARFDSDGPSSFDRELNYWIAEGVLELGKLSNRLKKYYVASRYSAIGTFDSDEGFLLGKMNDSLDLGFNTESVQVLSIGLGVRIHDDVTFKIEYAWHDFNLVKGVTPTIRENADKKNFFGLSLSANF